MKITLPNGVVIESDEAITVGDLTVTPISTVITEVDPVKHDQFFERLILEDGRPSPQELALGKVQRETLAFVRELGDPVAPSYVAEYFDITTEAAGQRLSGLTKLGLVRRVSHGIYQAVQ